MSVQLFDSIRSDNVHNILDSELSEEEGARVRDIIRAGDVRKNIYAPEGKRWQYEARTPRVVSHGFCVVGERAG